MPDIFQKYDIPEGMPPKVYFEKLIQVKGALFIEVSRENAAEGHLLIHFDGVFSYRHIDEGDILAVTFPQDVFPWPICTVGDSSYLKWFHRVSHGVHLHDDITHYCIATPNEVIDVLTDVAPQISLL